MDPIIPTQISCSSRATRRIDDDNDDDKDTTIIAISLLLGGPSQSSFDSEELHVGLDCVVGDRGNKRKKHGLSLPGGSDDCGSDEIVRKDVHNIHKTTVNKWRSRWVTLLASVAILAMVLFEVYPFASQSDDALQTKASSALLRTSSEAQNDYTQPLSTTGEVRHPFSTSQNSWSAEQVEQYEYENTPKEDPNLSYFPRVLDQTRAEISNTEEEVRYISNIADIVASGEQSYTLLIRVLVTKSSASSLEETNRRWNSILERFEVPAFLSVRVQYVETDKNQEGKDELPIRRLFSPPEEPADWIFVIQGSSYVHLSRLVRCLFANIDPTQSISKSLLFPFDTASGRTDVPWLRAGILFTRPGIEELDKQPQTESCWDKKSVSEWSACLSLAAPVSWTPMSGLNPMNVREMMQQSLDGSLFEENKYWYWSVGGAVSATARLPITYANMSDEMFDEQLAVDSHRGRIPKILHHIWSGPKENMSEDIREAAKECMRLHEEAGWEYMLWDDGAIQSLPEFRWIKSMMDREKYVRHLTDVVRVYILHVFGGVYMDMDAYCIRPFDPLLTYAEEKNKDFLVNYESQRHRGRQIANGILVSAPASPVLSAIILHLGNRLRFHFSKKDEGHIRQAYKLTGPWVISEVRDQWESFVQDHMLILSSSAFIPLYKDEGNLQDREDVFKVARRQGSFTIQMYHHGSLKGLLQSKRLDDTLMIVAHADDEVIFGGEYLLAEGNHTRVVVTSTLNEDTATRKEEFNLVAKRLGFHGTYLDGADSPHLQSIEGRIQNYVRELVCSKEWKNIITHGAEGEYGHPQHQQVFDMVIQAVKLCNYSVDQLFVFQPHPTLNYNFPEEKEKVAELYRSQKNVVNKFSRWKENIVPFAEYDYLLASKDCLEGQKKHKKTRKCRLHEMFDLKRQAQAIPEIFTSKTTGQ